MNSWTKLKGRILSAFRTKEGEFVLGQKPNLPAIAWISLAVLGWLIRDENISWILSMLSMGFGIIWSIMELTTGVNRFRKTLGGIVLVTLLFIIFRAF